MNFLRSRVLVLGSNSVQSLLPSTLISQAEAFLDAHRVQDAVEIADQLRRKLQSTPTVPAREVSSSLTRLLACSVLEELVLVGRT